MRLIVIGSAQERRDLRDRLESAPPDIVAEFDSLADAREAGIAADAMLVATAAVNAAGSGSDPDRLDSEPLLVEPLTPREIDVLELVAQGLSNKAVAARLGISDQTVKFHLASISGKLGAANRTDAVRRAVRRGLVTL